MTRKELEKRGVHKFEIRSEGAPKPVDRTHRSPEALARMEALKVYNDQADKKAENDYWGD